MKEPGLIGDSLPEGVAAELTVGELEEMACRQQQQIESQRQLLAAKEQRLRFLKQHEAKHQLVATEHDRLRRLRDKVETQEQKLRKLRALRGQVDHTKLNNVSLTSDLESIRALFNEKEKELSMAVAKVEELTRQLEELQRGRDSNSKQVPPSVAAVELEKLRSELLYRNKLNEQHSARLSHQRELLAQRQEEMTAIDRRIGELQERLHRKRVLNQQLAHHVGGKHLNRDDNQNFAPQPTYEYQQQSSNQNQSLQKSLQFHQHQHQHQQQQQLQQKLHQQKLYQMQQIQLHKQQQQQMQMQVRTSPSGFSNLSAISKNVQPKPANSCSVASQGMGAANKILAKSGAGGVNIAAVEPYHHVPSAKSSHQSSAAAAADGKRGSRKSDQPDAAALPSNQRLVYASSHQPPASHKEPPRPQPQPQPQPPLEDRLLPSAYPTYPTPAGPSLDTAPPDESGGGGGGGGELWPNKLDCKYQTLPSGGVARYNPTRYDYRRPAEGVDSSTLTANLAVADSNLQQKFNANEPRLSDVSSGNVNVGNVNDSNSNSDNNHHHHFQYHQHQHQHDHDDHIQNSNSHSNSNSNSFGNGDSGSNNAFKESAAVATEADVSARNGGTVVGQQQPPPSQPQQTNLVRSTPIHTATSKGLATPLSNANYLPRCTVANVNANLNANANANANANLNVNHFSRCYETTTPAHSGYDHSSLSPSQNQSVIASASASAIACSSSTVLTYTTSTYQKPVSSVSPIYQTSSTRIQPVQPQIIASFSVAYNQANQANQDGRKSYPQNEVAADDYPPSKPALPPKPAAPVKATPPPPPRQSAFHSQFVVSQLEGGGKNLVGVVGDQQNSSYAELGVGSNEVDANGNAAAQFESRLAALESKERPGAAAASRFYSRDALGDGCGQPDSDSNANVNPNPNPNVNAVRGVINTNARIGIAFHKDVEPPNKAGDSPPPLPNVEPPSDDDVDRSPKLKTIYVQNVDDDHHNHHHHHHHHRHHQHHRNNNANANEDDDDDDDGGRNDSTGSSRLRQMAINDRLMSDLSQDSSSSDTSSAENHYLVSSNRRIELPPAYLFPESGAAQRHLLASDVDADADADAEKDVDVVLNLKSAEQLRLDASQDQPTTPSSLSPDSEGTVQPIHPIHPFDHSSQYSDDIKKMKKGNLKNTTSANHKRRVSFDPLALLLDASLEGELELVVRTAAQVKNPSAANDEGITALHNAICAGHFEIVKFLVQFGCDVNAQDSDGWTPLHCAASCNNLPMVRFLVEHGACIFATTLSDQETAAEKCEEDEEGFDGCSEFLYSVEEKLGILNNGAVYAVFEYEAHNADELSFNEGDRLTVLRKGDEWEREWWWSRSHDKEGYIPRNLLGLYPRIRGNTNKLQD